VCVRESEREREEERASEWVYVSMRVCVCTCVRVHISICTRLYVYIHVRVSHSLPPTHTCNTFQHLLSIINSLQAKAHTYQYKYVPLTCTNMYMHIYMYKYVHIYMYNYAHIDMYTFKYTNTSNLHIPTCTYIFIRAILCTNMHMSI